MAARKTVASGTGTASALDRRTFLQVSLVGGSAAVLGAAALQTPQALASDSEQGSPGPNVQYGFLMDVSKCVGCGRCIRACRRKNNLPDFYANRRWLTTASNERGVEYKMTSSCMQCARPSCAEVCPAGAITKGDGGIVSVDKDRCIGCKYCYQACPFGVPTYNADGMDKCDCCLTSDLPVGEDPYCVQACIFGALHYGPMDEIKAAAGATGCVLEASTDPSYVLM